MVQPSWKSTNLLQVIWTKWLIEFVIQNNINLENGKINNEEKPNNEFLFILWHIQWNLRKAIISLNLDN